jgi:hypothetical protein
MIIIQPRAGLCNRLRAIASAISLAEASNNKVHVIWEMSRECNSRFSDLFELPAEIYRLTELNSSSEIAAFNSRMPQLFSRYQNCYIGQNLIGQIVNQQDWFTLTSKFRHLYISTWNSFFLPSSRLPFHVFIPRKHIRKVIEANNFDNMIGIHIRRSDNKEAIFHSPNEGFVEQINTEIKTDDKLEFFLATDEPSVQTELVKEFPGRIVTHKKSSLDRNDSKAIRDAVIDLFSLASCRKLIGSYYSSFSRTAADIHGIERVIIKEDKLSLKLFAKSEFSLLMKINEKVRVCENELGGLLVETGRGESVQLNNTSSAILNLCYQSKTVMEILNFFKQKYPAEAGIVELNVIETLESLLSSDVISVKLISKQAASEASKTRWT